MNPRWLALAFLLGLSGCFADQVGTYGVIAPPPRAAPDIPLGIEHGATIAVVLKSNTGLDGPLPTNNEAQKAIESCINDGLQKAKSPLRLSNMDDPQLRLRIDLKVYTTLGDEKHRVQPITDGAGGFAVGFSNVRIRQTTIEGEVYDVKRNEVMGRILATATGEEGGGLLMAFLIIPIPVGVYASTEAPACEYFGELLARRLAPGWTNRTTILDQQPKVSGHGCAPFDAKVGWVYKDERARRVEITHITGESPSCTNGPWPMAVRVQETEDQ